MNASELKTDTLDRRMPSPSPNQAKLAVTHTEPVQFVNLGCGSRFRPDWTNIDSWSNTPAIQQYDLTQGVPLADESADVVYHSHILEHFDRACAARFLKECCRVLKKGGIIRVVVPDLEKIARLYLKALEESVSGSEQWQHNYKWLMLEMYDQTVRETPGGGITDYFREPSLPNPEFVEERMGAEPIRRLKEILKNGQARPTLTGLALIRKHLSRFRARAKEAALHRLLPAKDYRSLVLGRFRNSGEIHKWMYDRYSLAQSLQDAGFAEVRECRALDSAIPGWADFHLDTQPDGQSYKPDSLYLEAIKYGGQVVSSIKFR